MTIREKTFLSSSYSWNRLLLYLSQDSEIGVDIFLVAVEQTEKPELRSSVGNPENLKKKLKDITDYDLNLVQIYVVSISSSCGVQVCSWMEIM